MSVLAWVIIAILFIVGMAGAVYPILPGALAIYAAFFVYGFLIGFAPLGVWFWVIQTAILAALFLADYLLNALGVRKFGGGRASVIGSTVGLLVGPFVIPAFGLIIGPFLGAFIGELLAGNDAKKAFYSGIGSLVGFFSSTVVKIVLQLVMIILFFVWVL